MTKENEYINCPMNEEQFTVFYDELMKAEVVKPKDFEEKFLRDVCLLRKWQEEENKLYCLDL